MDESSGQGELTESSGCESRSVGMDVDRVDGHLAAFVFAIYRSMKRDV